MDIKQKSNLLSSMNKDSYIDYHAHILPNIDDGVRTVDESILFLYEAKRSGINKIYATSHFYGHRISVEGFCEKRNKAYDKIKGKTFGVSLMMGAEVLLFPGIENMDGLDKLALEDSNQLLLELPLSRNLITEEHYLSVERLKRKYTVIIAHANRYCDEVINQMLEIGCVLQINGSDMCRMSERRRVKKWMSRGAKILLGSDLHRDSKAISQFIKAQKHMHALEREYINA